jgi:hypothetical protein
MIRIIIEKKPKTNLPLRNWGSTACNLKDIGRVSKKSLLSSKKVSDKIFSKSKQKVVDLKDKLPKKSIYKKYGYF